MRLSVENQLGYKMVKWIERIEFIESEKQAGIEERAARTKTMNISICYRISDAAQLRPFDDFLDCVGLMLIF